MRFPALIITIILLAACGSGEDVSAPDTQVADTASSAPAAMKVPPNGLVSLTAEPLLSEDAACVIPLRISNGTKEEVSVSMFGFAVTGSGRDDTGNMFPQDVPAGEYRTARIIQLGQSCPAFDTITTKDVLCKTGDDADCTVTFEDSENMRFVQPG